MNQLHIFGKGILLFAFIATFTSCFSSKRAIGIEEGWEVLGEQKVNFVRDNDIIVVNKQTLYTAIRFMVEDRDVHIRDLKIYFNNGDKLEPALDEDIKAGQSSKFIDITREGRIIDKIEFKYRTVGSILQGRANVIVLGRRYDPYKY
jgi:hypothetical protein